MTKDNTSLDRLAKTNNPHNFHLVGGIKAWVRLHLIFLPVYILGFIYFISALFMPNRPNEIHFVASYLGL